MALFGSVETVREQSPGTPAFAVAWKYIDDVMRAGSTVHTRVMTLAAGDSQKNELDGGVFAIEQAYETKARADGFFESHRKYIDIQLVIAGAETMEVADIARAVVRREYQEDRDLIVYDDCPDASLLRLEAGEAAVFFPNDVHMPSLRTRMNAVFVRKVVLKVPVAE